jgi:hypothetical protein
MGIASVPDLCQKIMSSLLQDLKESDVYLDGIGIWSNDFDSHIESIKEVLCHLDPNVFTVNPL